MSVPTIPPPPPPEPSVPFAIRSLPGDYIELVDENDPDGPVRICRADGTLVMQGPQSLFTGYVPPGWHPKGR